MRAQTTNNRSLGLFHLDIEAVEATACRQIAFSKVMKSERQGCTIFFLKAAIAYDASWGIKVEPVITVAASFQPTLLGIPRRTGGRITKQPQVKQQAAVAHAIFLYADDSLVAAPFRPQRPALP